MSVNVNAAGYTPEDKEVEGELFRLTTTFDGNETTVVVIGDSVMAALKTLHTLGQPQAILGIAAEYMDGEEDEDA